MRGRRPEGRAARPARAQGVIFSCVFFLVFFFLLCSLSFLSASFFCLRSIPFRFETPRILITVRASFFRWRKINQTFLLRR